MEHSGKYLHKRADGLVETPKGEIAVIMAKSSGVNPDGEFFFDFTLSLNGGMIRVQWSKEEKLQLFPEDVARGLLDRVWAVQPTTEAIQWYEELMASYDRILAAATPVVEDAVVVDLVVTESQPIAADKPAAAPAPQAPVSLKNKGATATLKGD